MKILEHRTGDISGTFLYTGNFVCWTHLLQTHNEAFGELVTSQYYLTYVATLCMYRTIIVAMVPNFHWEEILMNLTNV